jgi:hypothetical protein
MLEKTIIRACAAQIVLAPRILILAEDNCATFYRQRK